MSSLTVARQRGTSTRFPRARTCPGHEFARTQFWKERKTRLANVLGPSYVSQRPGHSRSRGAGTIPGRRGHLDAELYSCNPRDCDRRCGNHRRLFRGNARRQATVDLGQSARLCRRAGGRRSSVHFPRTSRSRPRSMGWRPMSLFGCMMSGVLTAHIARTMPTSPKSWRIAPREYANLWCASPTAIA
jgi:hypothetical protein